jgi:regulator of sigma E protease
MTTVLAFIVTIGVLVVWHEFGHFLAARLCGVRVERFSVGFGRALLTWRSKKSGTEWVLAAIPLGGYVAMLDERERDQPVPPDQLDHAFNRKPLWQRAAVVVAGPVANFLLAILIYWAIAFTGTSEPAPLVASAPAGTLMHKAGLTEPLRVVAIDNEPVQSFIDANWKLTEAAIARRSVSVRVVPRAAPSSAEAGSVLTVDFSGLTKEQLEGGFLEPLGWSLLRPDPVVGDVEPGGPASGAGLQAGDRIVQIDDLVRPNVTQVVQALRGGPGKEFRLMLDRAGRAIELTITPVADPKNGNRGRIGVAFADTLERVTISHGLLESGWVGVVKTWEVSALTLRMLGQIVTGQASLSNLSGPLTIADAAGKTASLGLLAYVSFLALVSVGLGVLNLLPVPLLDGGHLLYYAVEGLTGKAPSERVLEVGQRIGLVALGMLMVIALTNDFIRLLG